MIGNIQPEFEGASPVIRVVIADDHTLLRRGICEILSQFEDIAVVGEAWNGTSAVEMITALQPDVAVLDVTMPTLGGLFAAKALSLTQTTTRLLLVSSHARPAIVRRTTNVGASGFVLKSDLVEDLARAVRAVFLGGNFYSLAVQQFVS